MSVARGLSRRAVLAGLAVGLAGPALAKAAAKAAVEPVDAILARSRLGARSGFVLVDLDGGAVLEAHRAEVAFPPASVAKIVTALYALETLGPEYRFATRLVATGPVTAGVLGGDLVLAGSGDPVLDTDALGGLAADLAGQGVASVSGRFLVATGALPGIGLIDPGQPDAAGYNPSIAGLNLNFNRVYLQWIPSAEGPKVAFSAPGARFSADVPSVRAEVTEAVREPVRGEGDGELWLLPRAGMRGKGSLWLPVRAPGRYAGEVFGALAGGAGTRLPAAEMVRAAPGGTLLAARQSERCADLLRGMLFHSTNLTAEVLGLRATQVRGGTPRDLAASGGAMADWARGRFGLEGAVFVNHSGLTDDTHMTPGQMTGMLVAAGDRLADLLRERAIADGDGGTLRVDGVRVLSKTGTLDFVSALAGYIEGRGRRLAFAIFAADPEARSAIPPEQRAAPPGAKAWAGRARGQQQALLRRWVALYGG